MQKVAIDGLSPTKRVAFFLNIYQCMYVHQFFKMVSEGHNSDTSSIFSKLSGYINKQGSKQFHYNVAGKNYTLDEIKHGMLRGNKPRPGYFMRVMYQQDERTQFLPTVSAPPLSRASSLCRATGFCPLGLASSWRPRGEATSPLIRCFFSALRTTRA